MAPRDNAEPLTSNLHATCMCIFGQIAGETSQTEQATATVDDLVSLQKRTTMKTRPRRLLVCFVCMFTCLYVSMMY